MDIVFYIIVFIVGTLLGSFYATEIKRISNGKQLFSINSYCLNCGEKLRSFEKIPIISYIFLRGKCRYCNKKIEPIHIILETVTGILLLITVWGLKVSIININITNIISFLFIVLYYTYVILTIGIDIKNKEMSPALLAYGIGISIIYMIYSCLKNTMTIYVFTGYLIVMVLMLLINVINTKKRAQSSYIIDLLTMILIMSIFTKELICILTMIGTMLGIALYILINRTKKRMPRDKSKLTANVRIVSIIGTLNIFTFLVVMNI